MAGEWEGGGVEGGGCWEWRVGGEGGERGGGTLFGVSRWCHNEDLGDVQGSALDEERPTPPRHGWSLLRRNIRRPRHLIPAWRSPMHQSISPAQPPKEPMHQSIRKRFPDWASGRLRHGKNILFSKKTIIFGKSFPDVLFPHQSIWKKSGCIVSASIHLEKFWMYCFCINPSGKN